MNRYAQIALDQHRRHRPLEHALIGDPIAFFEQIGLELQAAVTSRRDEVLGPPRPGENPDQYRQRGYQAWATAEELTLRDHPLFQPESDEDDGIEDDPSETRSAAMLAAINEAIHTA
ncbi:MAG: hypothetical protein MUF83_01475 [Acidimicrobiales bacterium]|jgi:hypothetical protein|nr:hypothetical protein [Acidimicrobiales bacterium]